MRGNLSDAGRQAVDVEDLAGCADPRDIVGSERLCNPNKRVWQMEVVAVQNAYNFAGAMAKALVDAVSLSGVGFAHPITQPIGIALDDAHALIGAAAIDHDVFEVRVALIEHRPQCFLQETTIVEVRGDDADFREHGHEMLVRP